MTEAMKKGWKSHICGLKKQVAKYDKNPASELLDLSNEITSETASVYMEIGMQIGILLMQDMFNNINREKATD